MTLTEASRNFKVGTRIFGITAAILIFIRALFVIYDWVIRIPEPDTPLPEINIAYGPLPQLELENMPINLPTNYQIFLDLIRGELPKEPTVVKIFPVLKVPYGFLSSDRAKKVAATFDFGTEPTKLNTTDNLWTGFNRTFKINEQNLNFSYQYNYNADPTVFQQGKFGSQDQIKDAATAFMSEHSISAGFPADFQRENPQLFLLEYTNRRLQPTQRIFETNAARVDFVRVPSTYVLSNGQPQEVVFVSPNFISGNTNMLITVSNPSQPKVIEFNYVLWRYQPTTDATYPVMTSEDAWNLLQLNPSKYTVYFGNLDLGPLDRTAGVPVIQTIQIRDVFLAYYDPNKEMDFIQPVWVFTGKGRIVEGVDLDWIGYVPAIPTEYIQSDSIEQAN